MPRVAIKVDLRKKLEDIIGYVITVAVVDVDAVFGDLGSRSAMALAFIIPCQAIPTSCARRGTRAEGSLLA